MATATPTPTPAPAPAPTRAAGSRSAGLDWPDPALAPEPALPADPHGDRWLPDRPCHDEPADVWEYLAPVPDPLEAATRPDGWPAAAPGRVGTVGALPAPGGPGAVSDLEAGGALGGPGAPGDLGGWEALLVERAADGLLDPRAAFEVLAGVDLGGLDGASRVDVVRALERLIGVLAGWQQHAIAGVADASADLGLAREDARHEIGAALHLAPVTAGQRTAVALALRERHPGTLAALCAGDVSWRQAAAVVDTLCGVADPAAAAVEARVLTRMPGQSAAETRRALRDTLVRVDPEAAAAKLATATRTRRIDRIEQADGTRAWYAPFTPDLEHDLWTALTHRARSLRGALRAAAGPDTDPADLPSLDALRVDALSHAILAPTTPGMTTPGITTPGITTPGGTIPGGSIPGGSSRGGSSRGVTVPGGSGRGGTIPGVAGPDAPPPEPAERAAASSDASASSAADAADAAAAAAAAAATGTAAATTGTAAAASGAAGGAAAGAAGGAPGGGARPGPGLRPVPRCTCGGAQTAAVVIDLATLLGLAEHPGRLTGYGTIPAPLARAMAADRDWVRWTTQPGTRHLIDRGAHSYRPPDDLRAFVIARDRDCGFPGCHRPARDCDCDHVIAYRTPDGHTVEVNLGPLCRQHHNAKTHGRWRLSYDPHTRTKTWTSPLGKTYTKGTDPPLT